MARSTICLSCKIRPVTSASPEGQLCQPCLSEAEWENTHSDFDHAGLTVLDFEAMNLADLKATAKTYHVRLTREQRTRPTIAAALVDYRNSETAGCWVCHAELNEASAEYTVRSGTSRAGMTIHVSIRASGAEKAEQTANQIKNAKTAVTLKNKDAVTLHIETASADITLVWDAAGHYLYDQSSAQIDGKVRKVRNVAEALRIAA